MPAALLFSFVGGKGESSVVCLRSMTWLLVNFQVSQDPLSMIKRDLEGWREVLLPLNRLINWDKPFYPAIIVGVTTFIFL